MLENEIESFVNWDWMKMNGRSRGSSNIEWSGRAFSRPRLAFERKPRSASTPAGSFTGLHISENFYLRTFLIVRACVRVRAHRKPRNACLWGRVILCLFRNTYLRRSREQNRVLQLTPSVEPIALAQSPVIIATQNSCLSNRFELLKTCTLTLEWKLHTLLNLNNVLFYTIFKFHFFFSWKIEFQLKSTIEKFDLNLK